MPYANYVLMVGLGFVPSAEPRPSDRPAAERRAFGGRLRTTSLAVSAGVGLGLLMIGLSVYALRSYGAALVVPLVVLYWLFERRDSVPLSALMTAGALAGLAANLLLHAHCSSANLPHLLLGHASIGAVWALALRLVWRSPQPSR